MRLRPLDDAVDHRHEADMGLVLQADGVGAGLRVASVVDREGSRRQQSRGLQLLAAQADHQHLAAEVGVQRQVAHRADRDDRVGCVDRHAAAVAVLQRDHAVDVGVERQQFLADAPRRMVDHAGHALHRGGDRQQVARAHRAVGIAVALEGEALQRLDRRGPHGGHRQAFELARGRHPQAALVHPGAGGQRLQRVADRHSVAQHRLARGQVTQRDLVALRHRLAQHQAVGQHGAGGQAAVVGDDGHVVIGMHAQRQRRAGRGPGGRVGVVVHGQAGGEGENAELFLVVR